MNKDEKRALWMERIQEFQSSGQTCKSWCQNNQIAVSTMNYWMRQLRDRKLPSESDMIFAKMPSEQELSMKESFNSMAPVRIRITNSIRIEIMPDCPAELFHALIRGLKDHA